MRKKKYFLSKTIEGIIRDYYKTHGNKSGNAAELSQLLNIPKRQIMRWVSQLGLTNPRRPWTQAEKDYLEAHYHTLPFDSFVRKFKRTEDAIRWQLNQMNLRKTDKDYTAKSLAEGLGCSTNRVYRWINTGMLKATRRASNNSKSDYYLIRPADILAFVQEHPEEINELCLDEYEQLWLEDIINGGRHGLGRLDNN